MDKISFTGINKLSYTKIINNHLIYPEHVEKALASKGEVLEKLDVDLDRFMFVANDKGSKTLSELKEKFPNTVKDKNIIFDMATVRNPESYEDCTDEELKKLVKTGAETRKLFFVNGKKIEVNSSNMYLLGLFSKLFKMAAKTRAKPFVNDEYIESSKFFKEATKGIMRYPSIREKGAIENNFFLRFNDAQNVRPSLKTAADNIDNELVKLFA